MKRLAPTLTLSAAALTGCLALPLPPHDPPQASVRWLASEAGAATRAELLLRLGEPGWVGDGERVLVYDWHDPRLLLLLVGAGTAAGFMIEKEFDLVLRLDPTGRLEHYEVASGIGTASTGGACTAGGICVEGAGDLPPVPLADAARAELRSRLLFERNAPPEALEPVADACQLLVFPSGLVAASVWVDGGFLGFAMRGGWIGATLTPGPHRALVLSPGSTASEPEIANESVIACNAGSRVVLVQRALGLMRAAPGPLELWAGPPAAPPGGWRRFLSLAPAAQ